MCDRTSQGFTETEISLQGKTRRCWQPRQSDCLKMADSLSKLSVNRNKWGQRRPARAMRLFISIKLSEAGVAAGIAAARNADSKKKRKTNSLHFKCNMGQKWWIWDTNISLTLARLRYSRVKTVQLVRMNNRLPTRVFLHRSSVL